MGLQSIAMDTVVDRELLRKQNLAILKEKAAAEAEKHASEYEKVRLDNIRRNQAFLASLGLANPSGATSTVEAGPTDMPALDTASSSVESTKDGLDAPSDVCDAVVDEEDDEEEEDEEEEEEESEDSEEVDSEKDADERSEEPPFQTRRSRRNMTRLSAALSYDDADVDNKEDKEDGHELEFQTSKSQDERSCDGLEDSDEELSLIHI